MAENKDQSLSDNLAASSPPQGSEGLTPAEGTTAPSAPEGDKFAGKSREEILDMYKSVEGKYAEQGNELGQMRSAFSRVMPYFKLEKDPQTGEDSLVLNEEVVKALGQSYGWFQPQTTDNQPNQQPAIQNGNDASSSLDPEEQEAYRRIVREEIGKFREESVTPIQNQLVSTQHAQWIKQLEKDFPDFSVYRQKAAEYLNQRNLQPQSYDQLREAFITAKALAGGFVDKRETEAHTAELMKTLQTIQPGAGQPRRPVTEMSNAELFGLEVPDTPKQRAFEELTGVSRYKE